MSTIVSTAASPSIPSELAAPVTQPATAADNQNDKDVAAHKLGLTETIGLGGGGFGVRYRPKGSGFYIEPGAYFTFHGVTPASGDPIGRYLGIDPADDAAMDAAGADPGIIAENFLNRLDSNPYRLRVGFQGDIVPEAVVGPTIDFSFDPVQMGVAAVRGGQIFSYVFEQGEAAAEPIKPYLGEDIDAQADSARDIGAFGTGVFTGIAGLASSVSLGVGVHTRPLDHLEMGFTAGTSGLGLYRAVRHYDQNGDTAQAVLQAAEIKAGATYRF